MIVDYEKRSECGTSDPVHQIDPSRSHGLLIGRSMQCTSAAACKHLECQRIFRWGIGRRKCCLQKEATQHGPSTWLFPASRWFLYNGKGINPTKLRSTN